MLVARRSEPVVLLLASIVPLAHAFYLPGMFTPDH